MGITGLLWLFLTYGYVLFYSSNLIAEGSDLLLLIPSMAGLVGGVVLPILGAVPDGAIILFSGMGDLEKAQETLSVGVGALAGSIIMLLTVPWAMSVLSGRVDFKDPDGTPNYLGKPKLTVQPHQLNETLFKTGVALMPEVRQGGIIMVLTTIPYFLIQVPALFLHGPTEEVAAGEKYWALSGLVVCLIGFFSYLYLQLRISKKGTDKLKRVAVMKKLLQDGKVSLSGALVDTVRHVSKDTDRRTGGGGYQSLESGEAGGQWYPPPETKDYLREVLNESFMKYDKDHNSSLQKSEVKVFFLDFHEDISESEVDRLFARYDVDSDGTISEDEFIGMCYHIILMEIEKEEEEKSGSGGAGESGGESGTAVESSPDRGADSTARKFLSQVFDDDAEEEEEVPEDITSLPPHEQQRIIKQRAFTMLAIGTGLVLIFSDPMVDVMQEIASRAGLNSFYVAFVLAPLASNASEVSTCPLLVS